MKSFLLPYLCTIFVVFSEICAEFPTDITKCKQGDVNCIKEIINDIFHNKYEGIPGLNLPSLDPMFLNLININKGGDGPVNIKLKLKNCNYTGLNSVAVTKIKGFGTDLRGPHEIYVGGGGTFGLIGQYDVQGRVLLLPINGAGNCNLTFVNPHIRLRFHGQPVEKDGKTYMKINDLKVDGKISRQYMKLDNLFNGNKELSDNMNAFLNENWMDIFNELKEEIYQALASVYQNVISGVFEKISYEDLFSS